MPGTLWRTVRPLLLFVLVFALVFIVYSVGVAVATADKCGGSRLNGEKEWNYLPPRWDCVQRLPGQG